MEDWELRDLKAAFEDLWDDFLYTPDWAALKDDSYSNAFHQLQAKRSELRENPLTHDGKWFLEQADRLIDGVKLTEEFKRAKDPVNYIWQRLGDFVEVYFRRKLGSRMTYATVQAVRPSTGKVYPDVELDGMNLDRHDNVLLFSFKSKETAQNRRRDEEMFRDLVDYARGSDIGVGKTSSDELRHLLRRPEVDYRVRWIGYSLDEYPEGRLLIDKIDRKINS